jgi:DNA-directed RNA polymerase specialized sigma24 family protein
MKGRIYEITPRGRAALAAISPIARIQWRLTPKGRAALAEQPKPERIATLDPAGILRGESAAITDVFVLFAPLLRSIAVRSGVSFDDAPPVVTTLLDDVVMRIIETQRFPERFGHYSVVALKNRVRNGHRNASARETRESYGEDVLSEFAHAAAQPEADLPEQSNAVLEFASRVLASLRTGERELLQSEVSVADTAEQLGISSGTARVRLHRARTRLRGEVSSTLREMAPEHRIEVERLLHRAGAAV